MTDIKFNNEDITTSIKYNEDDSWDITTTQNFMMDKLKILHINPYRVLKNEQKIIILAIYNLKLDQIVFINTTDI